MMLSTLLVIFTLTIGLFLIAAFRLFTYSPAAAAPGMPDVNPNRYRPMERLLSEEDIRFLASRGVGKQAIVKMRSERRVIFRKYMALLHTDFARVLGMVRLAMVHSQNARPDLAMALLRARVAFTGSLIAMETRLLLHAAGFSIVIDARPAVEALAAMRVEWQILTQAIAPVAA